MPARSTMLTGQYVRTHGVVANGIPLPVDAPSVAQYLHDAAGYRTALLGKAHFEPGLRPAEPVRGERPRGAGRHRALARLRAIAAGHARGRLGRPPHRALRALAQGAPSRAPAQLRRIAPGRARRRHAGARDQEQPHPAGVVPHRLGGRPDRRLAAARWAPTSRGSAGCPFPTRTTRGTRRPPSCTACPGRTSTCRRGIPGSDDAIRAVLARKPRPLARLLGRPLPQHGGRAGRLRPVAAHPRPDPRDQRQGPRHERAHRRGLRARAADGGAAGLARRHRRDLHHRPRRDAGRLRPPLQGPVPHRRADAAALRVAAGPVRRHRRRRS